MPQLIAMIIVVVGAMIYMFQTFGGTGDKIEGIAQKTSVITEINNIKNGLKLAARSKQIAITTTTGAGGEDVVSASDLKGLADLNYFAEQINDQVSNNEVTSAIAGADANYVTANAYNAISFGGTTDNIGGMFISLVANKKDVIPGIFVSFDFEGSTLKDSAGFFESQIANDLKNIAYIDRHAVKAEAASSLRSADDSDDDSLIAKRTPGSSAESTTEGSETISDGRFIIYFKDFGANEIVVENK